MDYGAEIRAERARRRVTQPELAERLGISRHTIVDIEAGRLQISADQFHRILRALNEMGPMAVSRQ